MATHCCVVMATLLILVSFPFKSYSRKIAQLMRALRTANLPKATKLLCTYIISGYSASFPFLGENKVV
jgi:hypothetical protein